MAEFRTGNSEKRLVLFLYRNKMGNKMARYRCSHIGTDTIADS